MVMNDCKLELFYQKETLRFFESFIVGFRSNTLKPNAHSNMENIVVHNPHGPAIYTPERDIADWFIKGVIYSVTEDYCKYANMTKEETFFFVITYGEFLPRKISDLHPNHNAMLIMPVVYDYYMGE